MTLRAMVVDDEPLAVERMCALLARIPDVAVVATAECGQDAIAALAREGGGIDIMFLDVEMPQLDGFDLIEQLARQVEPIPYVVLVTAHECHAPLAFDSGVVDFLTKPVRLGRLETAVARVARTIGHAQAALRLEEVREQLAALRGSVDSRAANILWVQRRGESVRIDLRKIERLQAEGEYVRLFVDGNDYLHRESLTALLGQLDPDRYLRIHRSSVVEADAIVGVRRRATGSYQAILRDGTVLAVGRSYRAVVRKLINRIP
jgi:DNA-binding LytR/AlgR family response regulator